MSFLIEFDIPDEEVEEFLLDLGNILGNGKYVKLAPLKYRKRTITRYIPFLVPIPS